MYLTGKIDSEEKSNSGGSILEKLFYFKPFVNIDQLFCIHKARDTKNTRFFKM